MNFKIRDEKHFPHPPGIGKRKFSKTKQDAEIKKWVRVYEVLRITTVEEILSRPDNK